MSILNSILKTFVGDKTKKDLNSIKPLVAKINEHQKEYESLSNDQLREKTTYFKNLLAEGNKSHLEKIESLQNEVMQTEDLDQKEALYKQIDQEEEFAQTEAESILNNILPEAFAVVKETARRFVENKSIEVTATPFDRELSQTKPYIQLTGDKALGPTLGMLLENPSFGIWFTMTCSLLVVLRFIKVKLQKCKQGKEKPL